MKSITNRGFVNKEADILYKSTGGIMVLKRGFYFKNINTYSKLGHIEIDEIASFSISSNKSWELAKLISTNEENII